MIKIIKNKKISIYDDGVNLQKKNGQRTSSLTPADFFILGKYNIPLLIKTLLSPLTGMLSAITRPGQARHCPGAPNHLPLRGGGTPHWERTVLVNQRKCFKF